MSGVLLKDIVLWVADTDAKAALCALLTRPPALGIRNITADVFVHPEHDPGVFLRAEDLLRRFLKSHRYAMAVFDREGSGREALSPQQLEEDLEERLRRSGWGNRARAVAIDPELEAWVWSGSPQVAHALGWSDPGELHRWLTAHEFLDRCAPQGTKPCRPKEAMEAALHQARVPRSSAIYAELARRVSVARCGDRAFCRLRDTLRRWFPATHSRPERP